MKYIILPILALAVFNPSIASEVTDKTAVVVENTAQHELRNRLLMLRDFSANFSQTVMSENNEVLQTGQGVVKLKRPSMIYWQQQQPDQTLLISDGETTYYYDEFAEQVSVFDGDKLIDNSPFALLTSNSAALWQQYIVKKELSSYSIKPRADQQSQIESLVVKFDGEQLVSLIVADTSGQKSRYQFDNAIYNQSVANELFKFSIPEGVMIDDQR